MYANRRRIQGARGKRLLRMRAENVERSFAHCYDTGGMRRTHLRGRENILKRLLIHVGGFNLALALRSKLGAGTPRGLAAAKTAFAGLSHGLRAAMGRMCEALAAHCGRRRAASRLSLVAPQTTPLIPTA